MTISRSVRVVGLALAGAVLALVVVASLAIGTKSIPFGTVVGALTHFDGSSDQLVVRELRLPRTMVGLLVGSALGVSGALMQSITRIPSPTLVCWASAPARPSRWCWRSSCSGSARSRRMCGSLS